MQKRLLIIGYTWPEPATTAAGNRMLQLLHFFLADNYQTTFASTATITDLSYDLKSLGIQTNKIQLNHDSFDKFITELAPDLVLFDRFLTEEQFGWRVAQFAPTALRILDTEDLHSLRYTREKCFKKGVPFTTGDWLNQDLTKREIASIYRSDISFIISSYEMHLLKDDLGIDTSILMHLPFLLDPISIEESEAWNNFEKRTDFICMGNGKHAPNVDAIVWLKKEIWPLIRKELPLANLRIFGAYLPEHIQQMHNKKEGFLIEGWAEDAQTEFQKARVNLAPLRFGAGLKGKLISAMLNGLPSVTTTIGAEGIHGHMDFGGVIANNATEIASAAIALYQNQSHWKRSQDDGAAVVTVLYDKKKWIEKFQTKINSVYKNLEAHRTQNFVGAMLSHQTMASTKYMAKWIQEKKERPSLY